MDINKELENCPETIFDSFNLRFDLRRSGNGLREDLITMSNLYGRINKLATNAVLLYEQAKIRRDKIEGLAWEAVYGQYPNAKVTQQKKIVNSIKVVFEGQETSLNSEEDMLSIYEYVCNRGKDKTREISVLLDVGRSLLSWDKGELSKGLI
mgnify:CR=1 FL=1